MSNDRSDEELLSQIDELKARMDRLMRGGTSTSNSAVLTDHSRPQQAEPRPKPPPPPPARPTVRDLVPPDDREVVETYPEPGRPVPFPTDPPEPPVVADRVPAAPVLPEPVQREPEPVQREPEPVRPEPEPEEAPAARAYGGSVVEVEESAAPARPNVATFDDLGNVIKEELARDETVPPAEPKRGPGLASRFGGEEQPQPLEPSAPPAPEAPEEEPPAPVVDESDDAEEEFEPEESQAVLIPSRRERSRVGTIAAIWVSTALASGTIATLHFTGII
jgi:hypothetical protein